MARIAFSFPHLGLAADEAVGKITAGWVKSPLADRGDAAGKLRRKYSTISGLCSP
jgi:hypothetical protein